MARTRVELGPERFECGPLWEVAPAGRRVEHPAWLADQGAHGCSLDARVLHFVGTKQTLDLWVSYEPKRHGFLRVDGSYRVEGLEA
jgi:hypothetical protein